MQSVLPSQLVTTRARIPDVNTYQAIDALSTKQVENYSDKRPRKMADMYVVCVVSATLPL